MILQFVHTHTKHVSTVSQSCMMLCHPRLVKVFMFAAAITSTSPRSGPGEMFWQHIAYVGDTDRADQAALLHAQTVRHSKATLDSRSACIELFRRLGQYHLHDMHCTTKRMIYMTRSCSLSVVAGLTDVWPALVIDGRIRSACAI